MNDALVECQAKMLNTAHMVGQKRTDSIGFRISEADKAELQELAERDQRTLSQVVAFAVQEYIARRRAGAPVTPVLDAADPSLGPSARITPRALSVARQVDMAPAPLQARIWRMVLDMLDNDAAGRSKPRPARKAPPP